jgi:hypothetical protein
MTLASLAKLRDQGMRPATFLTLNLGVPAIADYEIDCTGTEGAQHLAPLHGLSVAIRHNDWSFPELIPILTGLGEIKPGFLLLLNHVTRETLMLVRDNGEVGCWDVTEEMCK